jgi:hypothetical protein
VWDPGKEIWEARRRREVKGADDRRAFGKENALVRGGGEEEEEGEEDVVDGVDGGC